MAQAADEFTAGLSSAPGSGGRERRRAAIIANLTGRPRGTSARDRIRHVRIDGLLRRGAAARPGLASRSIARTYSRSVATTSPVRLSSARKRLPFCLTSRSEYVRQAGHSGCMALLWAADEMQNALYLQRYPNERCSMRVLL